MKQVGEDARRRGGFIKKIPWKTISVLAVVGERGKGCVFVLTDVPGLILICVLTCNTDMREIGQRTNIIGLGRQFI